MVQIQTVLYLLIIEADKSEVIGEIIRSQVKNGYGIQNIVMGQATHEIL